MPQGRAIILIKQEAIIKKTILIINTKGQKNENVHKGRKCHFWKGGVTNLNRMIRSRFIYRQWVSDIFTRDSFTCQDCFKIGGILHAHHIIKLSTLIKMNKIKNIEEAEKCNEIYNLNNGMTLCLDCHKKRHKHNF